MKALLVTSLVFLSVCVVILVVLVAVEASRERTKKSSSGDTIVLCPRDAETAMEGYLDILSEGKAPIEFWDSSTRKLSSSSKIYRCVRFVPFDLIPSDALIHFVNTEQLSVPSKLVEFQNTMRSGKIAKLYDYSQGNIDIAKRYGYEPHLFPVSENEAETKRLRSLLRTEKKLHDVAVVGAESPHRHKIVDGLRARGVKVDFITGVWGKDKDRRIGRCRMLLNLHYNDDYRMFEPIRCNRWKYAGLPVLSEPSLDDAPSGVHVLDVSDLDTLAAYIKSVLP